MNIRRKIDKRIADEGKTKNKLSARKEGDIKKIKMKAKKVPQFKDKPIGKNKRVANNANIPPRMMPSVADRMRFRQHLHQNTVKKPQQGKFNLQFVGADMPNDPLSSAGRSGVTPGSLPQDKPVRNLNKKLFARVANNVFRNEESVLDQSERVLHSRAVRRELSKQLNGIKFGEDKKIAELVGAAHIAEKNIIAENEKEFMSEFTGPTKTLVQTPEIKQELDENMKIQKRARPSQDELKFQKGVEQFADKFGINRDLVKGLARGFVPDPRTQSLIQREKFGQK